jgi:hypothetical protein
VTEQVDYNEPIRPWDSTGQIEQLATRYAEGQAAIEELKLLKPVLALAISKLPKQQLKLSLREQATIGELALQMKHEEKSGAILFRAVKA